MCESWEVLHVCMGSEKALEMGLGDLMIFVIGRKGRYAIFAT
jgi:hypothetical protein